ncbi:MAG: hypothetical protein KDA91_21525 [Planctomycetaceae bacterium]|nr:hypothetical protein [Planctomycetaceae bacterium]
MTLTTYQWDPVTTQLLSEDDGTTRTDYTHEPNLYGDLLSQTDGTNTRFYHFDARGDTRQLTDESETVTDSWTYDAWGSVLSRTGTTQTPFQLVGNLGYAFDALLDSNYIRARWYQSILGSWTSIDSIFAGSASSMYNYADNQPISRLVASGLEVHLWRTMMDGEWIVGGPKPVKSLYQEVARSHLACTDESPCPCHDPEGGCSFRIRLRGTVESPPFAIRDFSLEMEATPGFPIDRDPNTGRPFGNPKDDVCRGSYGRAPGGKLSVETVWGTKCVYDSSMFIDPGGAPNDLIPKECQFIRMLQHGNVPPGTPPFFQIGTKLVLDVPLRSVSMDFQIQTYCGCGPPDKMTEPSKRASGVIDVHISLPREGQWR